MDTQLLVRYRDKTGRGFTALTPITKYQTGTSLEEDSYNGEDFDEWIKDEDRTDGDIFDSRTSHFEIIEQ